MGRQPTGMTLMQMQETLPIMTARIENPEIAGLGGVNYGIAQRLEHQFALNVFSGESQ